MASIATMIECVLPGVRANRKRATAREPEKQQKKQWVQLTQSAALTLLSDWPRDIYSRGTFVNVRTERADQLIARGAATRDFFKVPRTSLQWAINEIGDNGPENVTTLPAGSNNIKISAPDGNLLAMDDQGRLIISPHSPQGDTWECEWCGRKHSDDSLTNCWDGWQGCGAGRAAVVEVEEADSSDLEVLGYDEWLALKREKVLSDATRWNWRDEIDDKHVNRLVQIIFNRTGLLPHEVYETLALMFDRCSIPRLDVLGISAGRVRHNWDRRIKLGMSRERAFCWSVVRQIESMRP